MVMPPRTPAPSSPMGNNPMAQGAGAPDSGQLRSMLKKSLAQMKKLAEENGINFDELLDEDEGENEAPAMPPSPPTAPPVPL